MGNHKKYKARDKTVQRMTREGLVQENLSSGEVQHMTKKMAMDFLQKGRVHGKGLYSSRTGKTFDADIILTETTDKNGNPVASFTLEFPKMTK